MRGTIGGRCVLRVRRISSYSSSAPFAAPIMIAASSPSKNASVRPAYIGLPWIRTPGVPAATSVSTSQVSSRTNRSGMNACSKRTLCEPEPFRPSVSPQSSSIVHDSRGATKSSSRPGRPPSSSGAAKVWPM